MAVVLHVKRSPCQEVVSTYGMLPALAVWVSGMVGAVQ